MGLSQCDEIKDPEMEENTPPEWAQSNQTHMLKSRECLPVRSKREIKLSLKSDHENTQGD